MRRLFEGNQHGSTKHSIQPSAAELRAHMTWARYYVDSFCIKLTTKPVPASDHIGGGRKRRNGQRKKLHTTQQSFDDVGIGDPKYNSFFLHVSHFQMKRFPELTQNIPKEFFHLLFQSSIKAHLRLISSYQRSFFSSFLPSFTFFVSMLPTSASIRIRAHTTSGRAMRAISSDSIDEIELGIVRFFIFQLRYSRSHTEPQPLALQSHK